MDQITIANFSHPDGVRRMMASDCSKASVDILCSPI